MADERLKGPLQGRDSLEASMASDYCSDSLISDFFWIGPVLGTISHLKPMLLCLPALADLVSVQRVLPGGGDDGFEEGTVFGVIVDRVKLLGIFEDDAPCS